MANVWKISTLLLAGALAIVVGRGAVQESTACDGVADGPTAEQITRLRLARAFTFLEKAEQELDTATDARPKERANALAQIAKAKASIELALAPATEPKPLPKPRPRADADTKGKTAEVANPFATPPSSSPFLASAPKTAAKPDIIDPWVKRKDPLSARQ